MNPPRSRRRSRKSDRRGTSVPNSVTDKWKHPQPVVASLGGRGLLGGQQLNRGARLVSSDPPSGGDRKSTANRQCGGVCRGTAGNSERRAAPGAAHGRAWWGVTSTVGTGDTATAPLHSMEHAHTHMHTLTRTRTHTHARRLPSRHVFPWVSLPSAPVPRSVGTWNRTTRKRHSNEVSAGKPP